MVDTAKVISACVEILGIQKPVDVTCLTVCAKDETANWYGWHTVTMRKNKIIRHKIFLSIPNILSDEKDINTIIAHEFVHAHMDEKGLWNPGELYHNDAFIEISEKLEYGLNILGFKVQPLYNPLADIT